MSQKPQGKKRCHDRTQNTIYFWHLSILTWDSHWVTLVTKIENPNIHKKQKVIKHTKKKKTYSMQVETEYKSKESTYFMGKWGSHVFKCCHFD